MHAMDVSGPLLFAARLGLSFTVRPSVTGNTLELRVSRLRLGGLPLPADWLLRLAASRIPAGAMATVDAKHGVVCVDLGRILPGGLSVDSVELTGGAVRVRLSGGKAVPEGPGPPGESRS